MVNLNSNPELKLRTFSSIFIVAVIVGGIIAGGIIWGIVATAIALLSMWEFYRMYAKKIPCEKIDYNAILAMICACTILLGATFGAIDMSSVVCSISVTAFVAMFAEVLKRQSTGESSAIQAVGEVTGGVAFIALPWTFTILIRSHEMGATFLLTLFFCTWCCDVAAYLAGSKFGRFKLCTNVSPNKTWEGFLGGTAASIICGGVMALIFRLPPYPLLILGALCGTAGQLGDLCESVLKREAGVKDSGNIIPGHGGFLDRFDSILINAAAAYAIFELVG